VAHMSPYRYRDVPQVLEMAAIDIRILFFIFRASNLRLDRFHK